MTVGPLCPAAVTPQTARGTSLPQQLRALRSEEVFVVQNMACGCMPV